jgi:hypothetical protein
MDRLKFLKESSLQRLLTHIVPNQARYAESKPWLESYFAGANWFLDSNLVDPGGIKLLIPESKLDLLDLENTRTVYSALKHLTPVQAYGHISRMLLTGST